MASSRGLPWALVPLVVLAGYYGEMGQGMIAAALIGGLLGFLVWNLHPARVFMGDFGSLALGGALEKAGKKVHIMLDFLPHMSLGETVELFTKALLELFPDGSIPVLKIDDLPFR